MTTQVKTSAKPRIPLSRERVLHAGIALADESGIESLSMRKLGQELGVEAMSLYNHVSNKEDLLDGMIDILVAEIGLTTEGGDWKSRMRTQILAARRVMSSHRWAPAVIETRTTMSMPMMKYMDAIGGMFLDSGFSVSLMHHAFHTLGSRVLGFTQELFDDSEALEQSPEVQAIMLQQMTAEFPNISKVVAQISHDEESIIGSGCDDDVEFVFSLDLILDGLERIRDSAEHITAAQKAALGP